MLVSRTGRFSNWCGFATDSYRETGRIWLVQKALGHSDLTTTMSYTHVYDEEAKQGILCTPPRLLQCRNRGVVVEQVVVSGFLR